MLCNYQIVIGDTDHAKLVRAATYLKGEGIAFNVREGVGWSPDWGPEETLTFSIWYGDPSDTMGPYKLAQNLLQVCDQEAIGFIWPDGDVELVRR